MRKRPAPDDRLRLDPRVHDLSVTVISILQRGELPYVPATSIPLGFMTDYSTAHHLVDCGEENRHNSQHGGGSGHVMFLRIENLVEPVSRGDLVSSLDPDYPPICYACDDDARRQGGIVLWCHKRQGNGSAGGGCLGEAGCLQPLRSLLEGSRIRHLVSPAQLRHPRSRPRPGRTGSSVRTTASMSRPMGQFTYESWLKGLQAGRTFITNGPALFLNLDGQPPGGAIESPNGSPRTASGQITWQSHYPLNLVELVYNGGGHADGATRRDETRVGSGPSTSGSSPMAGSRHAPSGKPVTASGSRSMHTRVPSVSVHGSPRRHRARFRSVLCPLD